MKNRVRGFLVGIVTVLIMLLFTGAAKDEIGRYKYGSQEGAGITILDSKTGAIYMVTIDTESTQPFFTRMDLLNGTMRRVGIPPLPPGFEPVK